MIHIVASIIFFLVSCTGTPNGIEPVADFQLNAYLGTWYEIARLDHTFERGLNNVTANYALKDDGGIKVINRGFSVADNEWNEAVGKAYFVDDNNTGHLKVSFFGPFYGSYIIFKLDKNYQYAFITSHNRDYLWLLSRTPTIRASVKKEFINSVSQLGFDSDAVIFVKHDLPLEQSLSTKPLYSF